MIVRLRPNLGIDSLFKQLTAPSAVSELDLTNCILLKRDQLIPLICKCTHLTILRCLSCDLRPSDLLTLLLQQLPKLEQVECSLASEVGGDVELESMREIKSQRDVRSSVPGLRRMYVEVSGDHNFQLLSEILRLCPRLNDLHVHFVRGTFWKAVLECRVILSIRVRLETFAFTSELPASCEHREWTAPLEFASCASVCANVTRNGRSTGSWSCVRFHDLADPFAERRILPFQLVAAAIAFADESVTAEFTRTAALGHVWRHVRQLCLVLVRVDASSVNYPTAGVAYRCSLRQLFSTALDDIVELNVSCFHFSPEMDLADVLKCDSLRHLQSLSVSPCGLRRPSALRRLAKYCPKFRDLDVRIERKGRYQRCDSCDGESLADSEILMEINALKIRNGGRPLFRNGLARLSLTGLRNNTCFWFIESCSPAAAVRLSECYSPDNRNYALSVHVLASASALQCLLLHADRLDFTEVPLQANLSRAASLEYLFLLSGAPFLDDVARRRARELSTSLLRLKCLHVHYQSAHGQDRRITWLRGEDSPEDGCFLDSSHPCFQCCSTSTFVGLAKPLHRHFEPFL
ncbi:hypothetical protein HPB50_003923 [Hyalomma asiaticum]|uniref:Uncharacterized protein n=1 Tax=Hyalomma asiaticum TaxID=266040 RepID=A0ACB7TAA7_HYAAI|nr:hypothetical protein HPB50_003923 [Hyalomma asiaticum]